MRKLYVCGFHFALLFSYPSACAQDFELLIEPIVQQISAFISNHAHGSQSTKIIVSIAGSSGVGKSYFAQGLLKVLQQNNINAVILKYDDFVTPSENIRFQRELDHEKLYEVLNHIVAGAEYIQKPVWVDGDEIVKKEEIVFLKDIEVILFEGTFVLCGPETYNLLCYSSLKIFIDAAEDDIRRWKWERELLKGKYARSKEKFDRDMLGDMENYYSEVAPTKKHADWIIYKRSDHACKARTLVG